MIRAHRVNATAQDDATPISGWNISPNTGYKLAILPGTTSCGILLWDEDGTLVATGAALVGTEQPCVLLPQTWQTIGMVDADLGWHLLISTDGTESQREIRINPAVDLPDEIHPVYGDDDMGLARATAAIDEAAHYRDDMTVTCPLGLGAGLGDVVSVPVDGVAVIGQVESITWTATPDGTTEQSVIRRHVAIAPEAFAEIAPPMVADDSGTATHLAGTSGNVLANDEAGLTVTAVNGLTANVGTAVDGDNGGAFTIAADGSWTFSPDGDFALLSGSETADTSVTYHASDGTAEAMATLTVTVSRTTAAPIAVDDTGATDAATTTSGNVLANDTDADLDTLTVSQVAGSAANVGVAVAGSAGGLFTIGSDGAWTFDPDGDFAALTGEQTATTSVTYHVSDGVAEDEGALTVTVSAAAATATQCSPISTGTYHSLGLKSDGTCVATGVTTDGRCDVSEWIGIIAVSAGNAHSLGLKSDGTVVATGRNTDGQCNVSGWTDIIAIASGKYHSIGLKSDGTVVATGLNNAGQCNVSGWTDIVAIAGGQTASAGGTSLGLKSDGTVVATGLNSSGQLNVSGWTDIVAIAGGLEFTIGLKSDGTCVAAGSNANNRSAVSEWTGIVGISAGGQYSYGWKSDGTVVATGVNNDSQLGGASWTDIEYISTAVDNHILGLKSDGTVVGAGNTGSGRLDVSTWSVQVC